MADLSQFPNKTYESNEVAELADAPVDALQGLSKGDVEAVQKEWGIRTVRQLAEHKFVRAAKAITLLASAI